MPDDGPIVLVHPGFPRTGTGSVRRFLEANRAALAPVAAVIGGPALAEAEEAARHFARHGRALALADLAEALSQAVAGLPRDGRHWVLSAGGLMGEAPEEGGGWTAAAPVAGLLAAFFAETRPGARLRLVWTTRSRGPWVASVWRAALAARRLREDLAAFAARIGEAADLDAALAEAAGAAGEAGAEGFALSLEEAATHPLGPGGAVLELLDLPQALRAALLPVPAGEAGPDAAAAARLLALHRSALGTEDWARARAALVAG